MSSLATTLFDRWCYKCTAFECLMYMEWITVFWLLLVQVFLPEPLPHWDKFNVLRVQVNYFDLMGFKSHDLEDIRNFSGRPRFWNHKYSILMPDKVDFWEIKFSFLKFWLLLEWIRAIYGCLNHFYHMYWWFLFLFFEKVSLKISETL